MTIAKKIMISGIFIPIAAMALSSCATISEDECLAGSWQDIGYNDGRNGESRGKFADIAKTCGKFEITPDWVSYMRGYDAGLPLYCTFDRGLAQGSRGSSVNGECRAIDAIGYMDGHAEGYAVYQITSAHQGLIDSYEATITKLADIRRRLEEEDMDQDERKRLRKKELRLEDRREDDRIEIRAFERIHGLPKYEF